MTQPIIAVDIDDVLADSTEALRVAVNERLGVNLLPEHYRMAADYWGYYEAVWEQHGLKGKITLEELDPQMQAEQEHVRPYEGAYEVLSHLRKSYRLVVVTARNSSWRSATERWLERQFPGIFSSLVFADGKEGVKKKSKGQLCLELGASYLIDDNVEHAKSAHDLGIEVVLFGSYGWHHSVPPHFARCKDWPAVKEYFDGR